MKRRIIIVISLRSQFYVMYMSRQIESLHPSSTNPSCTLSTKTLCSDIAEADELIHFESRLERFHCRVAVLESEGI